MCEDLKQIIKKQTLYLVCYLKKEQKLEYKTYNNHLSTFSFFRPFFKKNIFDFLTVICGKHNEGMEM